MIKIAYDKRFLGGTALMNGASILHRSARGKRGTAGMDQYRSKMGLNSSLTY
jgi:hypothetical protein